MPMHVIYHLNTDDLNLDVHPLRCLFQSSRPLYPTAGWLSPPIASTVLLLYDVQYSHLFFPPKLSTSLDLNISVYGTSIWFLKPETGRLLYLSHQLHLIFQQILSILKENYMLTFSTSLIFISVSVAQATMFSFLICLNTFLPGSLLLLSDHSDQSPFSSSRMIFHRSDHVVSLHKFPQSHLPYHHLVVYSFTRPFAISPLSTFPTSLALSFTTFLFSR